MKTSCMVTSLARKHDWKLMNSLWKCMIELKKFEAIKYFRRLGYYTGNKTDCKTRVWFPFLMNSLWKCMIELKKFEAIKYFRRLGYYTGKKTDCKTRAWFPFLMNSFRKCRIELKNIWRCKLFSKNCLRPYTLLFCWPNKSLWNFRIPKLNIKIKKIKVLENDSDDWFSHWN